MGESVFRAVARDGELEVALSALRDRPLAKAEREGDSIRIWPGLGSSPEPVPRLAQFPLPGEPFGVLRGAGRGVVAVRSGGLHQLSEPETSICGGFPTQETVLYQRWSWRSLTEPGIAIS